MKTFKLFITFFFTAVFVLSLNSCSKDNEGLGPFNKVADAGKFRDYIILGGDDVQILDFRSAAEFRAGHIPGAKNFEATVQNTESNDTDFCKAILNNFDKNRPLYMYGGNNAILQDVVPGRISKIGFEKLNKYILMGGFDAWKIAASGDDSFKIETGL